MNLRIEQQTLQALLGKIRQRFYAQSCDQNFHRDRKMLIYALSWPAAWLHSKHLYCSQKRYKALIIERLDAIELHGNPSAYHRYFPRYFLKCLQDYFNHYFDDLYEEFTQLRNHFDRIVFLQNNPQAGFRQRTQIEVLARLNNILSQQYRKTQPSTNSSKQMTLF